jgi:hypothetical protein
MSPELGSEYIARAYLINWAIGLGRLNIYAWDHPRLGIAPEGIDTPLTHAYRWIAGYLQNAKMTRCVQLKNGAWFADLTEADGSKIRIAWHPSADVALDPVQLEGATQYVTLDGKTVHFEAGSTHVHASRSPIVLLVPSTTGRSGRQPPLYVQSPINAVR